MGLKSFSSFALRVRDKRGSDGVRKAAKIIGVSPATLTRIESGRLPDLETFAKFCRWLGTDPAEFLDLPRTEHAAVDSEQVVHFKTQRELDPKTTAALARMVQAARRHWAPGISDAEI